MISQLQPPASNHQKNGRPAVFLDRDGTLNLPVVRDGLPYPPATLEEFQLYPGVIEGCSRLQAAGYTLVVATNQPDVGRGTLSQAMVEAMHRQLLSWIPAIARVEVCYDSGQDPASRRRKPATGMLEDAAGALGLDLGRSWMVGDRWRDIDCGKAAGVRTVFIDLGHREELRAAPDFKVPNFTAAVDIILSKPVS